MVMDREQCRDAWRYEGPARGVYRMQNRREFLNRPHSRLAPAENYWLHVNRAAMACRFEVTLPLSNQSGVLVAREALDEVDRLEQQMTVFRESSEVSHINRHAASGPVKVEPSLFALLVRARELYRETEGAFDITAGPLTKTWGFFRREGRLPDQNEVASARSLVSSEKLLLDYEARTIQFERSGVEINLGSIGKGYALDRVAALIRKGGVRNALLNAGSSSMRAIGRGGAGQSGWSIGLRHPRHQDRRLALLTVHDCALSTSGSEEQFFEVDGKRFGHILDPRSGQPAEGVTSVTVVAQSAAVSDALATAFFVGGRELAERYCATHPDVLVIMLESGSETPVVIGRNQRCELSGGLSSARITEPRAVATGS
jgi:thiamine biosynthesis lipoprotein